MVAPIKSPRAPPSVGPATRTPRAARRDRSRPAPFYRPRRPRDVIRKILEHCGLWEEARAPARAPPVEAQASLELRYEADPDYILRQRKHS